MYKNENSVSKNKYWLEGSQLDPLHSDVSLGLLIWGLLGVPVTLVFMFASCFSGDCSNSKVNMFMVAFGVFMIMALVPAFVFITIKLQGLAHFVKDSLSGR